MFSPLRFWSGAALLLLPGLAQSASNIDPPAQYVYVANSGSNNLYGYRVDPATGTLTSVPSSPFASQGPPWSVAIHPSGRFVYATGYYGASNITGYALDSGTGKLSPLSGSPFPSSGNNNMIIAIQPSGKFAYVAGSGYSVSAYEIDSTTGALSFAESSSVAQLSRRNMLIHPSGKYVYMTQECSIPNPPFCFENHSAGVFGYSADDVTGALTPIVGSPFPAGLDPQKIASDPTGKFLFVSNRLDISVYTVDPPTGRLTPVTESPFAVGTSPLALAVSPNGKFLYVPRGDGNIWGYAIDSLSGALFSISSTPVGVSGQISLALTVECAGKFLYAANYYTGTVAAFAINSSTGTLTGVPGSPFIGGNTPLAIASTCAAPTTDPTTLATLNGLPGHDGWYLGPVTVTLSATAGSSPVSATYYKVDGDQYLAYGAPISISMNGIHQLLFYSVDTANHQEVPHGQTIKIDSTKPVSHVATLPSPAASPNFNVQWSGSDATSGLLNYSVYVSDNNGPFTPWLNQTMTTQKWFGGYLGHSYGFYSAAQDLAGNVEVKQIADATTTVPAQMPADVNGDAQINCLDVAIIKAHFGAKAGQPAYLAAADVNHDGVINVIDLAMVTQKLIPGTTCQ